MHLRATILFCLLGCVLTKNVQFSCNQIREFVDGHNERRLRLANGEINGQPAASEMKYMIWDDELAAKAAKWASGNQFSHNPDTTIGSGRFTTGENLFIVSTTNLEYKGDIQAALDSWFGEHKDYNYGPISYSDFRPGKPQVGHYTQMAWSNTVYVGCAVSRFSKEPGWISYLTVCNYGPAGNIIGRYPYPSGGASKQLICSIGDCSRPYGDKC